MIEVIKRKEVGSSALTSTLPIIMTVVIVAIMLVSSIGYMGNFDMRDRIDVIAREYMLRMETSGYLTEDMRTELENALIEVGVRNVDLTGTTDVEVGYGQQILLCISGEIQIRSYSLESLFGLKEEYEWTEFTLPPKSSTAKH